MKNTVLIFDFDGTIADTYHYMMEISNRLAAEFKYESILPDELDGFKDKTSQEIIRHLKVPIIKIPAIISKAKKEYRQGISSINPINGLKETLHELKKIGVRMGIFSSNSSETIRKFLCNHNLDIFDFIQSTSKVWSKNTALKRLIQKNGFHPRQIIYVCDEIRDITAVRKLGIKVAAVTWGYNSSKALKKYNPDFLLNSPDELLSLWAERL